MQLLPNVTRNIYTFVTKLLHMLQEIHTDCDEIIAKRQEIYLQIVMKLVPSITRNIYRDCDENIAKSHEKYIYRL